MQDDDDAPIFTEEQMRWMMDMMGIDANGFANLRLTDGVTLTFAPSDEVARGYGRLVGSGGILPIKKITASESDVAFEISQEDYDSIAVAILCGEITPHILQ